MSDISRFLAAIRTATFGEEVRGAIHDAIEQCYDDVSSAKTLADDTIANMEQTISDAEAQIDETKDSALYSITSTKNQAVSDINTAKNQAVTAANNATESVTSTANTATSTVNQTKESAVSAINTAVETINQTKTSAVNTINQKVTDATQDIDDATEAATSAAEHAETAAGVVDDHLDDIVVSQTTRPSSAYNKVWLKPGGTDIVLAEMSDVDELKSALTDIGLSWNIIPPDYHSGDDYTNNGIRFIKNADGSVSSSGTATGQARYYWCYGLDVPAGTYMLKGVPANASSSSFSIQYASNVSVPAASGYSTAYVDKTITVAQGEKLYIRTWYKADYVDSGTTWNIQVCVFDSGVIDSKYNPKQFVPLTYQNKNDMESVINHANKLQDVVDTYKDVTTWKQFNHTGSSKYDYIKCSPRYSDGNTSVLFEQKKLSEQYNIVYFDDLTSAQSAYDATIGSGRPSSTSGWITTENTAPTNGKYYIILLRFTNNDAGLTDGNDIISFTHYVPTEDNGWNADATLNVPVYPAKESGLINAVTQGKDSDTIVFCAVADPHYNSFDHKDNHQDSWAKRTAYLAKEIGADFITVLGDMIEGYNDYLSVANYKQQYVNSSRMQKMIDAYVSTGVPFMYVAGHHECFPIAETSRAQDTLDNDTPFEQNRGFFTSEMKPMVFGVSTLARLNTTKGYAVGHRKLVNQITDISDPNMDNATLSITGTSISYYFDITKNGNTVRFLVVDGTHFTGNGYSPDTVTFVQNALSDASTKGYKVVIMNHIPLRGSEYFMSGNNAMNESAFIDVLKTYGSIILMYLHGHVHADNIVTSETEREDTGTYPYADIPFPMVAIPCQKTGGATGEYIGDYTSYGIRNVNDYTGYCFDTITVNANTGAVNFYRFGAGDNGTYPTRSIT